MGLGRDTDDAVGGPGITVGPRKLQVLAFTIVGNRINLKVRVTDVRRAGRKIPCG
jgi:hypothetical protein